MTNIGAYIQKIVCCQRRAQPFRQSTAERRPESSLGECDEADVSVPVEKIQLQGNLGLKRSRIHTEVNEEGALPIR